MSCRIELSRLGVVDVAVGNRLFGVHVGVDSVAMPVLHAIGYKYVESRHS